MKTSTPVVALPGTVNLFVNSVCNFCCKHCYATFQDIRSPAPPKLREADAREIIRQIATEPLPPNISARKITFVGGEPTLCPFLPSLVADAKQSGLVTAVITNGLTATPHYLKQFTGMLDWVGLSIDALTPAVNLRIGRATQSGVALTAEQYLDRVRWIRDIGAKLKINTVVSALNCDADLSAFITEANPVRWKLLQVTPMAGQNDHAIAALQIQRFTFEAFVARHRSVTESGITLIPEPVEVIQGSYVMISPDGRFIDNSQGRHRYSSRILERGLRDAFQEVAFDNSKFENRGGNYNPITGGK